MKKLLNNILLGKYSPIIFALISAIAVLLNYSYRFGYVYIDVAVFMYFSFSLFLIAVVSTIFLVMASVFKLKDADVCNKKAFIAVQCIFEIFTIIFSIIVAVNFIVGGNESFEVAIGLCKEALPVWLGVVCIAAALFIVPNINNNKVKKILSAVMVLIIVFVAYSFLFPISAFKFTSSPVVFDNGTEYAVVFSTNDKATAYIEYDYNGEHIKKYDADNGRKAGNSTIHTIKVAYEQLSGNTYKVGAKRVIDELSYGGRMGKTIESENITFHDDFEENVNVLTVSDWHTHNALAEKAVSYLGDYNAVILLGDAAPGMMFEYEVADYILSFASDLSKGTMPVIFARGNHETRGREAANLSSYLGVDSFYYKTSLGNYDFIVLDSGEDKEDSHPEYGDMVVYEQNRKDMINWLTDMKNDDNRKTITLSHADAICIEDDLSKIAHNKLDELGTSLLVSGHEHITEFKDVSPYPILIDGGINANGKNTYVASMLKISSDYISVISVDSDGETILNEMVAWR